MADDAARGRPSAGQPRQCRSARADHDNRLRRAAPPERSPRGDRVRREPEADARFCRRSLSEAGFHVVDRTAKDAVSVRVRGVLQLNGKHTARIRIAELAEKGTLVESADAPRTIAPADVGYVIAAGSWLGRLVDSGRISGPVGTFLLSRCRRTGDRREGLVQQGGRRRPSRDLSHQLRELEQDPAGRLPGDRAPGRRGEGAHRDQERAPRGGAAARAGRERGSRSTRRDALRKTRRLTRSARKGTCDHPRLIPPRLAVAVVACAALSAMPAARSAPAPESLSDLRPLLVAAIDAADGRSAGTLAGPLAEVLRSRGISAAPLLVEVTTLVVYRQPGCKRLNVRFQQRDVKIGNTPPSDRELAFQLNYCRDGRPPRSLE